MPITAIATITTIAPIVRFFGFLNLKFVINKMPTTSMTT